MFGALLQYPGSRARSRSAAGNRALRAKGALAIVAADPLALTLLAAPGELGADIAVGIDAAVRRADGFGGPHAAYIATGTR